MSNDELVKALAIQARRDGETLALVARIRELEAENAKIDDLDEALRQRDREILGLRRDRDARDARIGELEGELAAIRIAGNTNPWTGKPR